MACKPSKTSIWPAQGEIRAVIGPNGAGKTTLASMISGRIRPSSGRIFFKERDADSELAAAQGIVYTFQITSIFQNLTCYDNVALAIQQPLIASIGSRIHLDAKLACRRSRRPWRAWRWPRRSTSPPRPCLARTSDSLRWQWVWHCRPHCSSWMSQPRACLKARSPGSAISQGIVARSR